VTNAITIKRRRKSPEKAREKLVALGLSKTQLKKNKSTKLPPLSKELPSIHESFKTMGETLDHLTNKVSKKHSSFYDLLKDNRDPDAIISYHANGTYRLILPSLWFRFCRWIKRLYNMIKL
jgi:hypothetical protein